MNAPEKKSHPRWERRKDARPEEIVAAALDVFVERGFAATKLEDVAARAGVSKGTLYLYFANKEELFKAVVREGLVSPLVEARHVIDSYQGGSGDLLELVMQGWWEKIGSTRICGIPKLILSEARNFPEIANFYLSEVVQPGHQVMTDIIRRGIASGEFRNVDADDTARLFLAPLLMIALWRCSLAHFASEQMDPQRLMRAHIDMLRQGLANRGPTNSDGAAGRIACKLKR
jgi:AcrR family transcriptional regulator